MLIIKILNAFKQLAPTQGTKEILTHVRFIQEKCNTKFYDQSFYGNDALNRTMLLDANIAQKLTPEVLVYIFTHPEITIKRNNSPKGKVTLRDAIYYGFIKGPTIIKLMPNNEGKYGEAAYEQQQKDYYNNTARIISNIFTANLQYGAFVEKTDTEEKIFEPKLTSEINLNPKQKTETEFDEVKKENIDVFVLTKLDDEGLYDFSLPEIYEAIVKAIHLIKERGQSAQLLYAPGHSANSIRRQVDLGFQKLCSELNLNLTNNEIRGDVATLDDLCEKILQSPGALLHGKVNHLWYDPVHLKAAIEKQTFMRIGNERFTYEDLFRKIIQKLTSMPDRYPKSVKEQFYLRFKLVKSNLQENFADVFTFAQTQKDKTKEQMIAELKFKELLDFFFQNMLELQDLAAIKAAVNFHAALKNASKIYFDGVPNQRSYAQFRQSCEQAAAQASLLKDHRGWKDFFTKLFVTIFSIGMATGFIAVRSKMRTGSFKFRMLDTESDRRMQKIKAHVEHKMDKCLNPTVLENEEKEGKEDKEEKLFIREVLSPT